MEKSTLSNSAQQSPLNPYPYPSGLLENLINSETKLVPDNSENLRLSDFINLPFSTVEERAAVFSQVIANYTFSDNAVWMRETLGGAGAKVKIKSLENGILRDEIMLGSNNYLGFSTDPFVVERVKNAVDLYGTGAGGPPLLNGTMSIHRELEAKLARLKEAEDCMLFASGYQANLGWIEALVQRHDVLIYDQQSHASLIDGISMTRDLKRYRTMRFRHNSVQHLRSKLEKAREGLQGQIFVAVEGVYSMCGDLAPLPEIQSLCKEYGAFLVVDDAHGTGVMGKTGRGTSEHFLLKDQPDLTMGTLSKAFGAIGGFLCGSKAVIDYLRFFSRSYMFSAHLPPTVVAGVSAGVDLLVAEPERVQVLRDNVEYLLRGFQRIGLAVKSASAIIAIRIGKNIPIRPLTLAFHQAGIFLNCIEYPAVSKDNQCLRLSVMATHSKEQLDHVISSFSTIGKDWGFIKV